MATAERPTVRGERAHACGLRTTICEYSTCLTKYLCRFRTLITTAGTGPANRPVARASWDPGAMMTSTSATARTM